jgi:CRP-like cAMP-binding protein
MIVSGDCDVFQESGGVRHHLRRMTTGDVFGEMAILTDAPRTATVVATSDVTVKVVTADAFDRELSTRTWAGRFVRAIAERFRDIDGRLAAVRSESPKRP